MLLENTRSDNALLGGVQDVLEPLVTPLSKNCRWNTDVPKLAKEAGLKEVSSSRQDVRTLMLGIYNK